MDLITPGIDGVYGGSPLFIDVTCVSPVHGTGEPMPRAADHDGAAVERAATDCRTRDYPDVQASPRVQLLSLGVEIYGRWSLDSLTLLRQLAKVKSRNVNPFLVASVRAAFFRRWWSILSVVVQREVVQRIIQDQGADISEAADTSCTIPFDELFDFHR